MPSESLPRDPQRELERAMETERDVEKEMK